MAPDFKFGVEQPSEFYDYKFVTVHHWKEHYTKSPYFHMWQIIVDKIQREGFKTVLDLGCGPGQMAAMLKDSGISGYKGIDFSPFRIAFARKTCPSAEFVEADVVKDDSLETFPYDCVLMLEFLEHIEGDIEVISRIRKGATMFASVPNFPARGHVRHFISKQEVIEHYSGMFSFLDVQTYQPKTGKQVFFLMQGVI